MVDEFFRGWLTFSLMILGGAAGAAFWAFRSGLFRDQDRARSLPLWAETAEENDRGTSQETPEDTDSDDGG